MNCYVMPNWPILDAMSWYCYENELLLQLVVVTWNWTENVSEIGVRLLACVSKFVNEMFIIVLLWLLWLLEWNSYAVRWTEVKNC